MWGLPWLPGTPPSSGPGHPFHNPLLPPAPAHRRSSSPGSPPARSPSPLPDTYGPVWALSREHWAPLRRWLLRLTPLVAWPRAPPPPPPSPSTPFAGLNIVGLLPLLSTAGSDSHSCNPRTSLRCVFCPGIGHCEELKFDNSSPAPLRTLVLLPISMARLLIFSEATNGSQQALSQSDPVPSNG